MSSASELDELHTLISSMRRCIATLQSQYGDIPPMRRIVNDADRLLNDIGPARHRHRRPGFRARGTTAHAGEKIPVPDTQYDTDFWRGVDDEGVGGQFGSK